MTAQSRKDIDAIMVIMADLGYVPSGNLDASFVEFRKDYGNEYETARVVLQFEKPTAAHEGLLLQHAVVTRQEVISLADPGLVDVPLLVRDDVVEVRRRCFSWMGLQEQAVVKKTCSRCAKPTKDFFELPAAVYCLSCMDALEKQMELENSV